MKWDLVWAIVGKDFKEFKKNKYVLYTLVTFPIVFTIIMPVSILGSILSLGGLPVNPSDVGGPFQLDTSHSLNQTSLEILEKGLTKNETLRLHGYILNNISASYIIIDNSSIKNSRLDYVIIYYCNMNNVTIEHGQIYNSYLKDTTINHGEVVGSKGRNVTITAEVTESTNKIADMHNPRAFQAQDLVDMMSSMVLMMFVLIPSAAPTVISSYSIIGEKKNRSLEPILATPISDLELLAGKIMASFIPTIVTTFAAYAIFVVLMQMLSVPLFGVNIAFTPILLIGVFLVAPLVCILSIVANVFVSSKVNDVRAAQQLGSLVVLPLIFLFMIPLTGAATIGPLAILFMALVVGIVDAGLMWFTLKVFNRENILVNWS
jgi:ABC-2 type transport system permease protein